jgi:hypothetical protein
MPHSLLQQTVNYWRSRGIYTTLTIRGSLYVLTLTNGSLTNRPGLRPGETRVTSAPELADNFRGPFGPATARQITKLTIPPFMLT